MMNTKVRFDGFALFDYAGVEKHLEKMAAKGWQLSKIVRGAWIYKKAVPAKVRYAVTFIPTVSAYDPVETNETARLDDYCESVGWKKVTDWLQMQIYCTDDPDAKPLETDESVRLDVIRRSMRRSYLVFHILFLLVFLLQGWNMSNTYQFDPIGFLSQDMSLYLLAILISGISFIIFNLIYLAVWLYRSKKSVEAGGTCVPVRYYRVFAKASLIWILILLVLMLYSIDSVLAGVMIVLLLVYFLTIYAVQLIHEFMRHRGFEKGANIGVTIAIAVVFALIFTISSNRLTYHYIEKRSIPDDTYYEKDIWWNVYYDNIPVRIEDLMDTVHEKYSYQMEEKESFLLSLKDCEQSPIPYGADAPYLWYEVLYVKYEGMYDWCLNHYLNQYEYLTESMNESIPWANIENKNGFAEVDVYNWQTGDGYDDYAKVNKIYRNYSEGKPINEWILCRDKMIINVQTEWELTDEQMRDLVIRIARYEPIEYDVDFEINGSTTAENTDDLANGDVLMEDLTYQFADGTTVKCQGNPASYDFSYQLEDGTEILTINDKLLLYKQQKDNKNSLEYRWKYWNLSDVVGVDEEVKEKVCTYLESLELGYDIETALENAYADYLDCEKKWIFSDFQTHDLRRYMTLTVDRETFFSYENVLFIPEVPHFTGTYDAAKNESFHFDKKTGAKMISADFFTLPEEELREWFIDYCVQYDPASRELVEKHFSLDYVYFNEHSDGVTDSMIQIRFPAGTVNDAEEYRFLMYEEVKDILQPWAVPEVIS